MVGLWLRKVVWGAEVVAEVVGAEEMVEVVVKVVDYWATGVCGSDLWMEVVEVEVEVVAV